MFVYVKFNTKSINKSTWSRIQSLISVFIDLEMFFGTKYRQTIDTWRHLGHNWRDLSPTWRIQFDAIPNATISKSVFETHHPSFDSSFARLLVRLFGRSFVT